MSIPSSRSDDSNQRQDRIAQMVSRELHDKIVQMMAAALTRMELAEHYYESDKTAAAQAKWDEARETVRVAMMMAKDLAVRVRMSFAEDAPATAEDVEAALTFPVHDEAREELYLVLREAVDNALTHSGAQDITIRISVDQGGVTATVRDNGMGIPDQRAHSPVSLGLRSMQERVNQLGGTLSLASLPCFGTEVRVRLPDADGSAA